MLFLDLSNEKPEVRGSLQSEYIGFKRSVFPAGEVFFKIMPFTDAPNTSFVNLIDQEVTITANPHSSDAVMEILMANDALRQFGFRDISLRLDYTPYARQDRVVYQGESFSFKVFAKLINSCGFKTVTVFDPHSYVTTALIDNCKVDSDGINAFYSDVLLDLGRGGILIDNEWTLIAPDAGAEKKVHGVYQLIKSMQDYKQLSSIQKQLYDLPSEEYGIVLPQPSHVATGTKHRNSDGSMTLAINDGGQQIAKTAVIVDDICDGGRTFIEVAKVLREEHNVEKIILIVTVGIFSKGLDVFDGHIDMIYAWNRLLDNNNHMSWENVLDYNVTTNS